VAPGCRLNSEHWKKLRRNHFRLEPFRLTRTCKRENVCTKRRDGRERMIHLSPIDKIGIGNGRVLEIRLLLVERHQLVGPFVWQRRKKHRIHYAEYRRIGSDSQR
jgi:hypothetical protein